ncbi:hypothetical protein DXG01_002925 [Tephrocybe rancida]|nr:hypothetical protein DXG01_002925 [Tephrocybe rancida]
MNGSEEDITRIAQLIQRGAAQAKMDDIRALKAEILDWITPAGLELSPPLSPDVKINRGFNHSATGRLLCPVHLDWLDEEQVSIQ